MTVDLLYTLETLAIGLVTGLLSGAFGVGGGIFCTPVLRLVLNVPAHVAVGTTMALIIPTAIVGAFNYIKQKKVDPRLVKLLALPAILGTVLGAVTTNFVQGPILMILFSIFAGLAGADLTFGVGKKLAARGKPVKLDEEPLGAVVVEAGTAVLVGFGAGFMAGFFGVGGGFILVPCLLYFFGISTKGAFGTSLVVIAAVSIPGTITHAIQGHVDLHLALSMVAGALPGSWLGSFLALRLKDSWLRRGFGMIMLAMAAFLAIKELTLFPGIVK